MEVPMRSRYLPWLSLLTALIVVVSVAMRAPAVRAAQGASRVAKAEKWIPPHTPWGEPDLQGVWSYANITPLERPDNQAGKERLTPEEIAALNREATTGADRRDGSPEADLSRAYNAL